MLCPPGTAADGLTDDEVTTNTGENSVEPQQMLTDDLSLKVVPSDPILAKLLLSKY